MDGEVMNLRGYFHTLRYFFFWFCAARHALVLDRRRHAPDGVVQGGLRERILAVAAEYVLRRRVGEGVLRHRNELGIKNADGIDSTGSRLHERFAGHKALVGNSVVVYGAGAAGFLAFCDGIAAVAGRRYVNFSYSYAVCGFG